MYDFNYIYDEVGLGSDWIVQHEDNTVMKIVSNEVVIEGDNWAWTTYKDSISSPVTRTTAKFTTKVSSSNFQLIIRANAGGPDGTAYMAKYSDNTISIIDYNGGSETELILKNYPLTDNTAYYFEFIADNSDLTLNLKNSGGTTIDTITTTDSSYSTGSVVISTHADFIFDDFKIEKFE